MTDHDQLFLEAMQAFHSGYAGPPGVIYSRQVGRTAAGVRAVMHVLMGKRSGAQALPTARVTDDAFRALVEACEAEFVSDDTEAREPDESKVSYPEERCHITFGHIRRARAALTAQCQVRNDAQRLDASGRLTPCARATDQQIREWCERHDIHCDGVHINAARDAFEDAQSLASPSTAAMVSKGTTVLSAEGTNLIAQAIGAHAAVVRFLVDGRPDLALAESKQWVEGFALAAERVKVLPEAPRG